jgi:hypothetical protein
MENKEKEEVNLDTIVDVCKVRTDCGLSCRGCKYYGEHCNHAIKTLKVIRPSKYITYVE